MKIVRAIFEKMKILIFFLCELPLIFRIDLKRKKQAGDICKGTLDIECERDWSVSLGAMLGNAMCRKLKTLLFQGFFRVNPLVSYCWASNVL